MFVYSVRNIKTGKVYVGATKQTIKRRWQAHIDNNRKNALAGKHVSLLGEDILIYGEECFEVTCLQECLTVEELAEAEVLWLERIGCYAPQGYNIRHGGSKSPMAESSKEKLKGRSISTETRKRMSEAAKHKPKPSARTRQKLSDASKSRSVESRQRGAEKMRGPRNHKTKLDERKVAIIKRRLLDGEVQEVLAKEFGVNQTAIGFIKRGINWGYVEPASTQGSEY